MAIVAAFMVVLFLVFMYQVLTIIDRARGSLFGMHKHSNIPQLEYEDNVLKKKSKWFRELRPLKKQPATIVSKYKETNLA